MNVRIAAALIAALTATYADAGAPKDSGPKNTPQASLTVAESQGESIVTRLSASIAVNDASTLHRTHYFVNDVSAPVTLTRVAVASRYVGREGYRFEQQGTMTVGPAPIQAIEILHMQFDVFGDHMRTLSHQEVRDYPAGEVISLGGHGTWYASENDVSQYLTSISYVLSVRRADGTVWHANRGAVFAEVSKIIPNLKREAIEPEKRKRESKE